MNVSTVSFRFVALLLIAGWLAGCVQTKTTPGYARKGDHIVIGLGGVERNSAGAPVLKASDLTITLTDANSIDHALEPRFIFKSYLDYGALMNTFSFTGDYGPLGLTDMVAYDGGWVVVAPLTTPGQYGNPLNLAVGPATISVESTKLLEINNTREGDLSAIPIEIISGESAQDNDFVQQFFGYSSSGKEFYIAPDSLAGIDAVGGGFLVVDYADDQFFHNGVEPVVVPAEHNPYVQMNYNIVPNDDGSGKIYVTLLNPAGFKTLATAAPNSSLQANLGVKLVYFAAGTPLDAKTNFTIDTVNSYYIDMSGAVLAGVSPTMTHFEDL